MSILEVYMTALATTSKQKAQPYDRSLTVRGLLNSTGIQSFMDIKGVTEVAINRPFEIFTESSEGWIRHDAPNCDLQALTQLANALAIFNEKHIHDSNPICSVVLPDGQRGQIVMQPASEPDTVSMTIRIPSNARFTLDDYVNSGRLSNFKDMSYNLTIPDNVQLQDWECLMLQAKHDKDIKTFLRLAVEHKLNIVLVGGTGSGKTTITKAIADLVPSETRILTIEDTHELSLPNHPNKAHLFFGKTVTPKDLVSACMRMKPDRVFLTELRGDEAWDYISLLNTGHPGSITTVHANDCRSAGFRIGSLIKQSQVGQTLDFDYIMREVMTTLDVFMFFDRTFMTQIFYDPVKKIQLLNGR